jgi:hypothetical protein
VIAPYLRLSAADASVRLGALAAALRSTPPCTADTLLAGERRSVPRWNLLARGMVPALGRTWIAVGRLEREADLTRRVLALRAGLPGPGPASPDCPGVEWREETAPDGSRVLFIANDPADEPVRRALPARFTVSAPATNAPATNAPASPAAGRDSPRHPRADRLK